jgi:hypothetical protein
MLPASVAVRVRLGTLILPGDTVMNNGQQAWPTTLAFAAWLGSTALSLHPGLFVGVGITIGAGRPMLKTIVKYCEL